MIWIEREKQRADDGYADDRMPPRIPIIIIAPEKMAKSVGVKAVPSRLNTVGYTWVIDLSGNCIAATYQLHSEKPTTNQRDGY